MCSGGMNATDWPDVILRFMIDVRTSHGQSCIDLLRGLKFGGSGRGKGKKGGKLTWDYRLNNLYLPANSTIRSYTCAGDFHSGIDNEAISSMGALQRVLGCSYYVIASLDEVHCKNGLLYRNCHLEGL